MTLRSTHTRLPLLILSVLLLLALQLTWLYSTYGLKRQELITSITAAFDLAYQKEQTYRIPVVDIINPGDITIQSCGTEEVLIIRQCPNPDTAVYSNSSGHSIENFINRVFGDLRKHITPLNIYCLSDLFAGMLHDMDISAPFVVERFDINTGEVLETSLLPGKIQPETAIEAFAIEISDTEAIRATLELTLTAVLGRMTGLLASTACLAVALLACIYSLFRRKQATHTQAVQPVEAPQNHSKTFTIGKYHFDPAKNELQGFGEIIQLNKKENAILYALCIQQGNVVERNALLQENWGSNGAIYSRSLDTYLTTLRKYLKQDTSIQIATVKGVGYKLVIITDAD
jgi:DNA-binding winged helix-turn-helix (wHTH) protein